MGLVHQCGASFFEFGNIHAQQLKSPGRGAIAARETRPDILMRVDEQVKVILTGLFYHGVEVVQILLVIDPGTGVFNGLPGNKKAQKIEPPGFQAGEMFIRLVQWERPTNETDILCLKKTFAAVCGSIGIIGHLGTTTQIDPAKHHRSSKFVLEPRSLCMYHFAATFF